MSRTRAWFARVTLILAVLTACVVPGWALAGATAPEDGLCLRPGFRYRAFHTPVDPVAAALAGVVGPSGHRSSQLLFSDPAGLTVLGGRVAGADGGTRYRPESIDPGALTASAAMRPFSVREDRLGLGVRRVDYFLR